MARKRYTDEDVLKLLREIDVEFPLLKEYDEDILKMLYYPNLKSGLRLNDPEPILFQITANSNRPKT